MIKSFSQIFKNQLIISFNSNVSFEFNFFLILIIFFCNNRWAMHQHQIRRIKNVTQISRKWCRKKLIGQKSYFVFKKCYQFFVNVVLCISNQGEHFQQFIKNIIFDFGSFDQTSYFFSCDICINRFVKFQKFCFV